MLWASSEGGHQEAVTFTEHVLSDNYSTHTSVGGPGTLVQAVEILPEGGMLSAADTKRIDSGACGAI